MPVRVWPGAPLPVKDGLVQIDAAGRVVHVMGAVQSLRDPGRPIPKQVTAITGISDADVAGVEFAPAPFIELLIHADVCVAHKAAFDARFIERLMPAISGSAWACSMKEFDWAAAGFDGCKLGYLLMQMGRSQPRPRSQRSPPSARPCEQFEKTNGTPASSRSKASGRVT